MPAAAAVAAVEAEEAEAVTAAKPEEAVAEEVLVPQQAGLEKEVPTGEEEELLEETLAEAQPVPEEAEKAKAEEPEAETVLSSTFIPRRIMQPRDLGKSQIRFAEDIFINRPGRSEDKPRKKKKKYSHSNKGKQEEVDDEG